MKKFELIDTLQSIQNKFTLIYILNCTDILFTYSLIKTGEFYEANYIMRPIVNHPFLSLFVKIIIPAILILALFSQISYTKLGKHSFRFCHLLSNIVIFIYLSINSLHVYYLIKLLF